MQMDRKTVEEAKEQIEKDLQELQLMFMRNERDLLRMRVQHLQEEKNGKSGEIEEKIKEILLDELTDIAKEMKKEKSEQREDGCIAINTPMARLHTVAVVYNTIWHNGGNGISYPARCC